MNDLLSTAEQFSAQYAVNAAGDVVTPPVANAAAPIVQGAVANKTISLADFLAIAVLIANAYLATQKTK